MITCVTYSALIWDTEGAATFLAGVSFSMVAIARSYNDDCQKKKENKILFEGNRMNTNRLQTEIFVLNASFKDMWPLYARVVLRKSASG